MNLGIKIAAFIITAGLVGAVSIYIGLFVLVALNGFSESDGGPGILLYLVWAFLGVIISGVLSVLAVYYLAEKKEFNIIVSGLISIVIFIIFGVLFNIVGGIAGVLFADALRRFS